MNNKSFNLKLIRVQLIVCVGVLAVVLAGCPLQFQRCTLHVLNNSSRPLTEVYVSGCNDMYWGSNQLDSPILPGERVEVGAYVYGCYDVLAVNESDELTYFWGETFDVAEEELSIEEVERSAFCVVNNSSQALTEIYVSTWDSQYWGPNRITSPILPGETAEIGEFAYDWYDLLAVNESGESTLEYAVFDESEEVWTISGSGGEYTDFYVMNDSSRTITELYVSPCVAEYWGPNQIDFTIPPGERVYIGAFGHGCYDLLAIADTGEYAVRWGEEFDQLEQEWTVSDTKMRPVTGDKSCLNVSAKVFE